MQTKTAIVFCLVVSMATSVRAQSDIDECALGLDGCDDNALCINTIGGNPGYICLCNDGYFGDGFTCTDIDECAMGLDDCDYAALCINLVGGNPGYICVCNNGFSGDGFTCTDIDECAMGTDNCDQNAECINLIGGIPGYKCVCNDGYFGDGFNCAESQGDCAAATALCRVPVRLLRYHVCSDPKNLANIKSCGIGIMLVDYYCDNIPVPFRPAITCTQKCCVEPCTGHGGHPTELCRDYEPYKSVIG